MSTPEPIVQIAFGDPPLTPNEETAPLAGDGANWVDVSAYVRGNSGDMLVTKRGRRNELSEIEAGDATVVLNNTDRRFDPMDSTGPYFGNILPMTKIRIGADWVVDAMVDPDPDRFWIFTGYVEDWAIQYPEGSISTATLTCTDGTKYLNQAELTDFNRSQEESGTRIDAILDEVGWLTNERSVAVGDIDVAPVQITKQSALAAIRQIAAAERGLFFFSGAGNATFQDRSLRNTLLSEGMWGDERDGSELAYISFTTRDDDSSIWNDIRVTRGGGIEQTATDATSINQFFRRTLPLENLPLVDDAAALEMADWTLAQFKDARVRPDQMEIDPAVRDSWVEVFGLEISDVISINERTLVDGQTSTFDAHVEGIQWRFKKGNWRALLLLSPSFTITPDTGTLNTTDDWIEVDGGVGFDNGWVDFGSTFPDASYRKEGNWVYLRGMIKDGTTGTSVGTAFTLPVGYRPPADLKFPVMSNGALGHIQIRPAGYVVVLSPSDNTYVDLSGIAFRVI